MSTRCQCMSTRCQEESLNKAGNEKLVRWLQRIGACDEAIRWVRWTEFRDLYTAWWHCKRTDWKLWLLRELISPHPRVTKGIRRKMLDRLDCMVDKYRAEGYMPTNYLITSAFPADIVIKYAAKYSVPYVAKSKKRKGNGSKRVRSREIPLSRERNKKRAQGRGKKR